MTPAMVVMLIFSIIGKIPKGLPVAVYNADHPPPALTHYSQNLLEQVDQEFIHLVCSTYVSVICGSHLFVFHLTEPF